MTIHASRPVTPAPTRRRRTRPGVVLLLLVGVVAAGWLVARSGATGAILPGSDVTADIATGDTGGDLPDTGVLSTDTDVIGVARMDPALLEAVQRAAVAASADGVELRITSGWRSAEYQQRLLDEAVDAYGAREARRIVQSPDRSRHVTGDAVDIGPTDAAFWMLRHGSDYGLCQVYANEVWHYELLVEPGGTCPPLQTDAS